MRRPQTDGRLPSPAAAAAALLSIVVAMLTPTASGASVWQWPTSGTTAGLGVSKRDEGSSDLVDVRYHMGPVVAVNLTVYPIWYGSWLPSQKRIIRAFIRSISPSPPLPPPPSVSAWWRTATLYTDQTGSNVSRTITLGEEKDDRNCSYGDLITRLDIQRIIHRAVIARSRPLPANPRGGIYVVFTSTEIRVQDFCDQVCGFHYFTFPSIVGYTLPYAWVGDSAAMCPGFCAWPFATPPGYAGGAAGAPPNGDLGVDAMVSVLGHELAELSTNPLANAWYAGDDPCFPTEIADLCEGIYGTGGGGSYTGQVTVDGRDGAAYNLNGVGGRRFLVQWLWHPERRCCYGPNALDQ